jgi:hypothetical protein
MREREKWAALLADLCVNVDSILPRIFGAKANCPKGARARMIRSASPDLPAIHPSPSRPRQARRPTRNGLAAAVAIAGSLVISSTAPAVIEGASDRATDMFGDVYSGFDRYGASFIGDSRRSTDLLGAVGGAFASSTETLAGSEICSQLSEIDATAPATGDSAPASPTRGRFCFGPHDVIEYYPLAENADQPSVDLASDHIPSAVRSNIPDSRLIVATEDDDGYDSRDSSESGSRTSKASARSKSNSRRREASISPLVGCARCVGQVAQTSPKPAKLFAFVFPRDFFRSVRSVRRERLPTGVARQREANRVVAWNFRRARGATAVLGGRG